MELKYLQNKFNDQIQYNHIFSKSEQEQKAVTNFFLRIFETRQNLIQEGLPGTETLDPILYTRGTNNTWEKEKVWNSMGALTNPISFAIRISKQFLFSF